MSDRFDVDMTLLTAYVWDECSSEHRQKIEAWLAEREEHRALVRQMRVARQSVEIPVPDDLPAFQQQIALRAGLATPAHGVTTKRTVERTTPGAPWRRGGGLVRNGPAMLGGLAVLVAAFGVLLYQGKRSERTTAEAVYHTAVGQRLTVRLADGSTMLLAPATSVTVTSRGVHVTGEAFFDIAHHSSRAFTVQTNTALVQVLGTKFNVRQYPAERASVVVIDGRVALSSRAGGSRDAAPTVLTAGMLAQVTDSGIAVRREVVAGDYTAWTQGRLVFNDARLDVVVRELARAYGAEIRLADSALALQSMTLAASVQDDPLPPILKQLAFTVNAHVVRDGAAFIIVPGPSPTKTPPVKRFPQPETQYGR